MKPPNAFQVETANLQARFDAEKANLVESSHSRLEAELLKREREIAERLRRERDRQLESAIRRLEEENSQTREETENAAQEKIRWVKIQSNHLTGHYLLAFLTLWRNCHWAPVVASPCPQKMTN